MKISNRLKLIASFVDDDSKVIDVGCDHALLDIFLVLNKKNIKEDLYKNFEIINEWINNSDNKTSIVLGIVGIILTIIFSNGEIINNLLKIVNKLILDINFDDILYLIIFILLTCFCVYGLYCLIKVLIPTLKIKFKNTKSFMYFGNVCKYSNFKEYKEDFAKGIKIFLIGLIGTIIMYIIGILIYL